jgi:hypothetical protein
MSITTVGRYCCGNAMELVRHYRDGNELVVCRSCGRREEIATSGYAVRPLREQVKTEATADVMAEIMAGLPAAL